MGLSPADVLAMPLHDYQAAIHHFNRHHSVEEEEPEPLGQDEFAEMIANLNPRMMQ